MKAHELTNGARLNAIKIADRLNPVPGPNEAVSDVKACSLNDREVLIAKGTDPAHGRTPGVVPLSDGAGVVSAVGGNVTGFAVGDRVAGAFMPDFVAGILTPEVQAGSLGGAVDGMLAEKAVLPEHGVVHIPDHLSFAEAATLP